VLRFFRELRLMLMAVHRSMVALFWCLVLLAFILYVFGLIIIQGVTAHIIDNSDALSSQDIDRYLKHFGSMQSTMLSLYKAVTGGADWQIYFDIVSEAGGIYALLFIFYTAFFTFVVMNILTGMIVENVVKLADKGDDSLMIMFRQKQIDVMNDAQHVFRKIDTDGSGTINMEEFQEGMLSDQVLVLMNSLDLEVRDAEWFFKMLLQISDTGEVDSDSFVDTCIKMKGTAKSIDLQCLAYETKLIRRSLRDVEEMVDQMGSLKDIEKMVQRMGSLNDIEKMLQRVVAEIPSNPGPPTPSPRALEALASLTESIVI